MALTVTEAEALVADRAERLARAEQLYPDRPRYIRKCQENFDNAMWRLRHAETAARS